MKKTLLLTTAVLTLCAITPKANASFWDFVKGAGNTAANVLGVGPQQKAEEERRAQERAAAAKAQQAEAARKAADAAEAAKEAQRKPLRDRINTLTAEINALQAGGATASEQYTNLIIERVKEQEKLDAIK